MFRPREPDLQSIDFVTRREQSGVSPIWLVPLAALLVGAWLAWTSWRAHGPEVTITFPATEGLRVGATPLLYRSVEVGEVRSLRLTPQLDGVVVTVRVAEELAPALTEGTRFQLVPRSPGEPAVIVVEPGPTGPPRRAFEGSIAPPPAATTAPGPVASEPPRAVAAPATGGEPVQPAAATPEPAAGPPPGTTIVLTAAELGGLEPGAPIRLRGVPVGRIGPATLTPDGTVVRIEASVDQPFDALLREGVRLRRDGVGVVLEPAADPAAPPLSPGAELALVEPAAALEPEPRAAVAATPAPPAEAVAGAEPPAATAPRLRAVVLQTEPLQGLQVGSPVTLQGVPIGEVEALDLAWDAAAARLLTPITVALDPARLRDAAGLPAADGSELVATLIERGLRVVRPAAEATSGPGVALELMPQEPPVTPGARDGLAVLPWAAATPPVPAPRPEPAEGTPAPAAVPEPLAAVAADPALRDTLAQLTATLAATEAALAGPGTQETLVAVRRAMAEVEQAGGALRADLGPTLGAIRSAAARLDTVLRDIRDIVRKDSVTRVQINDTLKELASAARSVRIFADDLQRHPEALLRGKGGAYR